MWKKLPWYSGIAAVFIYVFAVILGGILYPGYSHISQDISQLTSTESPIRDLMNVFFFYNLLVAYFGIGLYRLDKRFLARIASVFVIAIGVLGIIIAWFPINTRGTAITATGIVHIIIVSAVSLLTVANGFLFYLGYRNTPLKVFANVSLAAGLLFFVSGPVAALNVMSPYAGLFERIPIGIFLLWIAAASVLMLRQNRT